MKNLNILPILGLAALQLVSCQPDLDFDIPADKIGFQVADVVKEVSVLDGKCDVTVVKSGKGSSDAKVSLEIGSYSDIKEYLEEVKDTVNHFVMTKLDMFELEQTDLAFAASDRRKTVSLTWDVDAFVKDYSAFDAVIPIKITSCSIDLDTTRTLLIVRPFVSKVGFELKEIKNLYPNDLDATPDYVFEGEASFRINKSVATDVTVSLAIDNSYVSKASTPEITYVAAPEGLVSLKQNTVTIPSGEDYGFFEYSVDYQYLFEDGKFKYSEINFAAPVVIKEISPNRVAKDTLTVSYIFIKIADSKVVIRPGTPPTEYVSPEEDKWVVIEGEEHDMAHDPNSPDPVWYSTYNCQKLVDGNFHWHEGAMGNFFWTKNEFPISYTIDLKKSFIFDGFRLTDAKTHQNQYRHIRVWVAREFAGADTDWTLAFEGTRKFASGWQQYPADDGSKESLDAKFTFHMPEDIDAELTNSFELTKGRYIKLELVEPYRTTGDYENGRGYLAEFYINGWEL